MSNITDVYWEANGLSLHTHAWAVETKAGRMASAPKRGENFALPYKGGRTRARKTRESRTLTLPMWVRPLNVDGTTDSSMSNKAKVEENWNFIMSKLDVSGEFTLTKRFYDGGGIRTVSGQAELLDPPDITRTAAKDVYRFVLELMMADPWFYDAPITQGVGTITVQGNVETEHVDLHLSTGMRVTTPDGNWIQYNGSGTAVIDCYAGSAMLGGSNVNGLVERNPLFPEWLSLKPGVNAITGSGTIVYSPAYR